MVDEKDKKPRKDQDKAGTTVNNDEQNKPSDPQAGDGSLSAEEAKEVIRKSYDDAMGILKAASKESRSLGPLSAVTVSESDITNELEKGGPAFGSFVKSIGMAVADAQTALDLNMVNTAKALSETQIDVIAIFEQQIKDEDGTMDKGIVHLQKLPLINYIMPTVYQWSRVYLQADMNVSEFNAAHGLNIKSKSFAIGGGISFGPGMIAGALAGGYSNVSHSQTMSYGHDTAAGTLHMEATLEPRQDVELPKPYVLQKGPRLKIMIGAREDLDKDGVVTTDPSKVVGRRVSITAELKKSNGDPHSSKTLEVSVDNPLLNYVGNGTTGADGRFSFTVSRTGAAFEPGNIIQAVVRVWFGLVSDSVIITL